MKKTFLLLLLNTALSLCAAAQNVGIGTNSPAYKLDVVGTMRTTGTLTVNSDVNAAGDVNASGDVSATGDVTAHGGGVLYNTVSSSGAPASTNLKVYYRTAAFTVTGLGGHAVSIEGQVNIGGGFTSPPMVFVGDMTANEAETGQPNPGPLHQLQLVAYGATTGSFKIRILNTSNVPISQTVTWNVMCIGR